MKTSQDQAIVQRYLSRLKIDEIFSRSDTIPFQHRIYKRKEILEKEMRWTVYIFKQKV